MPKRGPTSGKDALGVSLLAGLLATVDEVIEGIVRYCQRPFARSRREMAAPTIDEMNQALGELLTECGRVEFTMLLPVVSEARAIPAPAKTPVL
jgi:hypothetical protein